MAEAVGPHLATLNRRAKVEAFDDCKTHNGDDWYARMAGRSPLVGWPPTLLARTIAICYTSSVKTVRYTKEAARDLKRHGNIAERVRKAVSDYADDPAVRANNVTQLAGSPLWRIRVGNFRAIFEETADMITVTKVRPRGSAYD
jgi:mRNA interferase RelE/StbE